MPRAHELSALSKQGSYLHCRHCVEHHARQKLAVFLVRKKAGLTSFYVVCENHPDPMLVFGPIEVLE